MTEQAADRGPYDPTVNFAVYVTSGQDSIAPAGGREHYAQAEADARQLAGQGQHGLITDARTGETVTTF